MAYMGREAPERIRALTGDDSQGGGGREKMRATVARVGSAMSSGSPMFDGRSARPLPCPTRGNAGSDHPGGGPTDRWTRRPSLRSSWRSRRGPDEEDQDPSAAWSLGRRGRRRPTERPTGHTVLRHGCLSAVEPSYRKKQAAQRGNKPTASLANEACEAARLRGCEAARLQCNHTDSTGKVSPGRATSAMSPISSLRTVTAGHDR